MRKTRFYLLFLPPPCREYELNGYKLTRTMVPSFKREKKKVHVEEIIPSVIEPSFGIGRIFYALLENSFRSEIDITSFSCFFLISGIL